MRPHVLLSCAMSLDGCIDDSGETRLVLSGAADLDRVDAVRAGCDAVLVGAGTLRRDNPRLTVRSAQRRAERVARGLAPDPAKVVLTRSGLLDPEARFFTAGDGERLVYAPPEAVPVLRERLPAGTVVRSARAEGASGTLDLALVLADLAEHGIGRLMVEGGTTVLTRFLTAGLVDELQLAIAPFFVGDPAAPRFVGPGVFPFTASNRLRPVGTEQVGDVVLLRYRAPERVEAEGADAHAAAAPGEVGMSDPDAPTLADGRG
jgi:5-amino-6-(5-phosphoribosylamino)uracil reductase